MPDYRLYCMRGTKIVSSDQFEAKNDEAAIAHVQGMKLMVSCEIWQENRLVCRVPASGF
jgi:hypothetical protein